MTLLTHNKDLPFIKSDWKGNKLTQDGLYTNLYGDNLKSFREVWRWKRNPGPLVELKKEQRSPLDWQMTENIIDKNYNTIIPIGHASFIVDINRRRLLIDPVLSSSRFLRRYTKLPFKGPELVNIDYILLSHNHRDHLDKKSVIYICENNPNAIILTGLGIARILRRWGVKNVIQEAGWHQRYNLSDDIEIDYLPSQHWSRRWLLDTNTSLWGSFMILDKLANKNIYFAGDSGYEAHFQEIGKDYDIEIAMIGVGAYEPRWFMKADHTSPSEGIQVFKDLKAKYWIPMHYGTFDVSEEPIYYPEKILKEQYPEELDRIKWMDIGARIEI